METNATTCNECGRVNVEAEDADGRVYVIRQVEVDGHYYCDLDCAEYFLRRTAPGGSERWVHNGQGWTAINIVY